MDSETGPVFELLNACLEIKYVYLGIEFVAVPFEKPVQGKAECFTKTPGFCMQTEPLYPRRSYDLSFFPLI